MTLQALNSLRDHWPEYLIEAGGLGLFMISAGTIATLLEYPQSTVHRAIADPLLRRGLMGLAMGATLVGLVYSPWGRQSGAHFNPVVTLTFFRLGKVATWDAVFYVVAQLVGGLAGVLVLFVVIGEAFGLPPVEFVVTVPGPAGQLAAFAAELFISFGLMLTVLYTTNRIALMRYTGLFAALLLAFYITFESPLSGTSMNPARTLASAFPSGVWQGLWIYLVAPLIGMLAAADAYRLLTGRSNVMCAKLNHITHRRCIFNNCGFKEHIGDASRLAAPRSQHGVNEE
jgi:aquaporin Z